MGRIDRAIIDGSARLGRFLWRVKWRIVATVFVLGLAGEVADLRFQLATTRQDVQREASWVTYLSKAAASREASLANQIDRVSSNVSGLASDMNGLAIKVDDAASQADLARIDAEAAQSSADAEALRRADDAMQRTYDQILGSFHSTAPAGGIATAICNDGTLSYAANHSGSCSSHGGVSTFLSP